MAIITFKVTVDIEIWWSLCYFFNVILIVTIHHTIDVVLIRKLSSYLSRLILRHALNLVIWVNSLIILFNIETLVLGNVLLYLAPRSHLVVFVVIMVFIFGSVWVLSWKIKAVFHCTWAIWCNPYLDLGLALDIWGHSIVFHVSYSLVEIQVVIALNHAQTIWRI